ncbi:MAG: hypothetical protein JWQ43_1230 [Glaciihabitans sp.]|nr:hypothetical protein [Glaciihabitans sp.]
MLHGLTRFPDFQLSLGIAPEMLATRLDDLVSANVFAVTPGSEYVLTPKGWELEPAIAALGAWMERWAVPYPNTTTFANSTELARPLVGISMMGDPIDSSPVISGDDSEATPLTRARASTDPRAKPLVPIEITVLGAFALRVGGKPVGPLSVGSQRLLVFLALHDREVGRAAMAGRMWPEASHERAGISLRSALSRLDAPTREAIMIASAGLSLAETVVVDLREARLLVNRLLQPGAVTQSADLSPAALAVLSGELLPDWYDDWVVTEAEDWRQQRLNALEAATDILIGLGRLAEAAGAARAAIKVDPLRESAHAALIRVHLSEGNQSEALRVFERYRVLLLATLGLEPTGRLMELVRSIRVHLHRVQDPGFRSPGFPPRYGSA